MLKTVTSSAYQKLSATGRKFVGMVFLLLFLSQNAAAQEKQISGVVKSSDDGLGLPGVTVQVKGSNLGVITDVDGRFNMSVSEDATLVFSFIGFISQEIPVGGRTVFDVEMEVDVEELEEVVVVGYGTMKKSDLTGAVSSIGGQELRGTITASVDQALQGRVAGVQVTQNSGQPGGAVSIRIRGTSSLTGSSEPLYVIDGVRVGGDAGGITGFDWQGGAGGQQTNTVNPLASLNPNDIESIDILKDASATAIYGSQAANGVVIITTKRGSQGAATVNYHGYYAVQEVYKLFDMMTLPQYAEYNNEVAEEVSALTANQRFADPSLLGRGTDWQEAIFQVAPMQSHTVTVSGGSEDTKYMVSGGYFEQDGIVIGSNFDRFNLRTNVDTKIKDWASVGASLALSRKFETITLNDGGDGVISQASTMAPHIPVRNFDGTFAGPTADMQSAQLSANPVGLALLRNNTVLSNRVMANVFFDFDLGSLVDGLKFRSEASIDYNNNLNKAFQPSYEWGRVVNPTSQLSNSTGTGLFWSLTNYATYSKTFGRHQVTAMLGYEALKNTYEGFTAFKLNVPNDFPIMNQGEVSSQLNNGYKGWNSLASGIARVNYTLNEKYLVTGTIRRDGSSRFGPTNRYGWFPSASVAWRVSDEPFLASNRLISNLKLRAGWGLVGNQEIPNYAFGASLTTLTTAFGSGVRASRYSNPDLKWESTEMINLGLDFALFEGRIDVSAEVYKKVTDDLLLQVDPPDIFGSQVGGPYVNVGIMENKGIEIAMNTVNLDLGKFQWTTTTNFTINRNEVTNLVGSDLIEGLYWYSGFQSSSRTTVGRPVGQFYGYVMDGIFTTREELENSALPEGLGIDRATGVWLGDIKWRDIAGPPDENGNPTGPDGIINEYDQTYIGDPNPDFTFGFNNSFSYGSLKLDVFIIGSYGGDIFNYSRARNESMTSIYDNQAVSVINRARTELIDPSTGDLGNLDDIQLVNPGTNIPRFDNGAENFNHHMSSRWIEDGTYLRIQNVKLSYALPVSLVEKARLSGCSIYANIQNVATFTKYSGLDPQIGAFNQSPLQQNIDMGRYPTPRVYTIGLSIDF